MEILTYQNGSATCGYEEHLLSDGRLAVLFSELPDNQGRSVTNAMEELATYVAQLHGVTGKDLVVAEHYPADKARKEETFDEVPQYNTQVLQ